GGEKFGLIRFDEKGNYLNFKANTSCAAGTGSFLDQQAERLGLSSINELSDEAFANTGPVPKIASRCSVFAKTDIVHAQQEGYSLTQICDGLCMGLAKNIVETLFTGKTPREPIIFTGGVSRNRSVVRHISSMIGQNIITESYLYGAAGAAIGLLDELQADNQVKDQINNQIRARSADDILIKKTSVKTWFYKPLLLKSTSYPDFGGIETFEYRHPATFTDKSNPVEVDIYESMKDFYHEAYLGIDIGSTSTKAVLIKNDHTVLAGFYTLTKGSPVDALRSILATIDYVITKNRTDLKIIGAGTTGSGRKFIGKIITADLVIDEITAHARAAVEIDPKVDTIIEIGGQDSKFTTLKNGMVTFSIMNTVCAAGTGSFIEEQAKKLGCPLSEYAARTENQKSPIASDRCTVFMERDINHYLSEGYTRDEVLASVLHSIVENYLTKVAIENNIGNRIFFQGATAKNRALVAAFEQRLKKPLNVSKYCHLTGALGTALTLSDQNVRKTGFKGISLYQKNIPITSEICELCANHCKISVAHVDKEKVAYGFMCGRDYDTEKFVNNNRSGFDLLKSRKEVFAFKSGNNVKKNITIGLPVSLHMHEDIPFWKRFFDALSIKTVTSRHFRDAVKHGKQIAGAEFCTPVTALYGHVDYLLDCSDYVFLPFYLEKKAKKKNRRRQFCYYTQFSPALIATATRPEARNKLLMPLEKYLYSSFHDKVQLYQMLKSILPGNKSFFNISAAYDAAHEFKRSCELKLKKIYKQESASGDLQVILLGRPYTVLSSFMNKRIPEIFGSLGVKAFFQDMLSYTPEDVRSIEPLLKEVHWNYAAKILESACVAAQTSGAYPVLITSFKCTPDSFVIDYFKKIMESYEKPYLILQLDDHDSSVGYETRIEAAIRSFKNHYQTASRNRLAKNSQSLIPSRERRLGNRTLLIPNWDDISLKLMVAAFQRQGIDARLLEENEISIQKSLKYNTGQCIPLNIIAQEFIDYVLTHDLDPAKTVLWTVKSTMACNLPLFPHHMKNIFRSYGKGMEKASVYAGELSFMDLSVKLPINAYFAYMFGGMIRMLGCKIRPYEKIKGETDQTIEKNIDIMSDAFLGKRSKEDAFHQVVTNFEQIEQNPGSIQRPKVMIFGDLYVRYNEVMNQDLIHFIEENGGEVIVMPFSSHMKMIAKPYFQKWFREGLYFNVLSSSALMAAAKQLEKTYIKYIERIFNRPEPAFNESPKKILSEYHIRNENSGESIENILKIFYATKHYPDISLFVQTIPAFCCPSLVTEAMAGEIERKTGVPIVSITYDGTMGNKNDVIIPYLTYPRVPLQEQAQEPLSVGDRLYQKN
ncbi:MAG: CoA activase, partial [Deltaproteobacteria bacterium]|nr:CoA activase [Deltaproteobacteria bacterium]